MRPIFHFKKERIESHIAMCYMSFSIIRNIEYQCNLTQKISPKEIISCLRKVESSIYIHKKTKDRYLVPGYFNNKMAKIYKTFNIIRNRDAQIYLN